MIFISEILNSFRNAYGYEFKINTLFYFPNRSVLIFRISKINTVKNYVEFSDIVDGKIYRNSISMIQDRMIDVKFDIYFLQHVYLSYTPFLNDREKKEMLDLVRKHNLT